MIPEMDDRAILMMGTSLLEQDLLQATILNEINMIDTWDVKPKDLVAALMAIIHSLYPFAQGAALLISDHNSELYMCGDGVCEQDQFAEINKLIIAHLWKEHSIVLKSNDVANRFIDVPFTEAGGEEKGPRLINFLLPPDKDTGEGLDNESSRFPQMGSKPEKSPELLLVGGTPSMKSPGGSGMRISTPSGGCLLNTQACPPKTTGTNFHQLTGIK